ncbi:hypothetical protein CLHUN_04390 [Ruminiclostridium hungatei]|uniref:DUF4071 domain-containing protein n=1 Tax=Ruminiclostridium hungatei TaxID=48256 RepID=A0A1V4SQ39_RUMHU|nr:hypothetical protein [Ruminiclostridium hungatei]OPX45964.1 hypothetical protein CLHUN_04390 [Ruminiclostridium hungatei]
MPKTCFVIMGFSLKKIPNTNITVNLDDTYKYLIKPVLIQQGLSAVSSSERNKHSFRCDEIYTTQEINKTFITNLFKADIVIADITALNQNAIYELGMRHAMKPKSTIILCDKKTMQHNKFFDITFNPQIYYDSNKQRDSDEIQRVSQLLADIIEVCKNSDDDYIDSPVFSYGIYNNISEAVSQIDEDVNTSLRADIDNGNMLLEDEDYVNAEIAFEKVIKDYKFLDIDIICSYILSIYKKEASEFNLIRAMNELNKFIDIENTTSENVLGILASINLKLFNLLRNPSNLYTAIEFYRRGSNYESGNIYCGRNYCSTLLKLHMIENDIEILKEYYYTSVHTAKLLINRAQIMRRKSDNYNNSWFLSNQNDLMIISNVVSNPPFRINYTTRRQQTTIEEGQKLLINDLKIIREKIRN